MLTTNTFRDNLLPLSVIKKSIKHSSLANGHLILTQQWADLITKSFEDSGINLCYSVATQK